MLTQELGAGPLALARSNRAQAARVLIETTDMAMSDIAFAAGFASIRQFNDSVRQAYALTPTEMRLLLEFSSAPGTVLSRDKLLERVWDYGWGGDTRVVDVHVQRLRTKIGQDRIDTVRGFGYKLRG